MAAIFAVAASAISPADLRDGPLIVVRADAREAARAGFACAVLRAGGLREALEEGLRAAIGFEFLWKDSDPATAMPTLATASARACARTTSDGANECQRVPGSPSALESRPREKAQRTGVEVHGSEQRR